jgi:hypothetical protein
MIRKKLQKNEFHDINKFPNQKGLLVFGLSMYQLPNSQNAKKCFGYVQDIIKKIHYPHVGLIFLYPDNLYLYQKGDPAKLNKKHQNQTWNHKSEVKKILKKNPWYIRDSFSFITWNQTILESNVFLTHLGKLHKFYEKDKEFKKYVNEDIKSMGRKPTKNNIMFVLEEILVFYLVQKGEIKLPNDYVKGHEKWVLFCYPGNPLKSEIYLFQKNIFKLKNPKNKYENSYYDLKNKLLYDYDNVDLKTLDLK